MACFSTAAAGNGLDDLDLLAVVGDSTETIYSLEHGRWDFIWPKTARKLAHALGVDADDLYR